MSCSNDHRLRQKQFGVYDVPGSFTPPPRLPVPVLQYGTPVALHKHERIMKKQQKQIDEAKTLPDKIDFLQDHADFLKSEIKERFDY